MSGHLRNFVFAASTVLSSGATVTTLHQGYTAMANESSAQKHWEQKRYAQALQDAWLSEIAKENAQKGLPVAAGAAALALATRRRRGKDDEPAKSQWER